MNVCVPMLSSCCLCYLYPDIRLVGGSVSHEGRVEVYHNGTWGTVSDDDWDLQDATVVCHELGYISATAAIKSARFGPGSGPILFSELSCVGNESSVTECYQHSTGAHNCTHSEDAGVVCASQLVSVIGGVMCLHVWVCPWGVCTLSHCM